jgi:hypothetical protein
MYPVATIVTNNTICMIIKLITFILSIDFDFIFSSFSQIQLDFHLNALNSQRLL